MFRFETFGAFLVVDEAGTEVATQPRRLALLALLAVAGERGLARAKLQAYLWPDSSAESARHGLEQLLYYLRRQLTPDAFLGQDPLRLNPTLITSDVSAFEQALARGADGEAVALYRGPFLDGFFVNGAPGFERWLEEERSRFAETYRDALGRLAETEGAKGRYPEAIGWWRKLVASDPLSERATLGLMRALAATGDRPAAMLLARGYAALVRDELDAPLPPNVAEYLAKLCEESPQPSPGTRVSSPMPSIATPVNGEGSLARATSSHQEARGGRRPRSLLVVGVGLGAIATIGAFLTLALRPTGIPSLDPNLVAVAPFDVFGAGLDLWHEGVLDLLSRRLDGAGPLRSVAPSVIVRRWSGRGDEPSAMELGRQTGAGAIVYGSLVGIGSDSVRLNATLLEIAPRRTLFEFELRNNVDQMDRLVDSAAIELLEELGRTRSIGPVHYAQTTSLPALKAFLRGEQYFRRMAWDSAENQLRRAVALDSTFGLALRRFAEVQRWKFGAGDSFAVRAMQVAAFNRGLSPRESLLVVADSVEAAIGYSLTDPEFYAAAHRWLRTWEQAARSYPDDPEAWYGLGEARWHHGPEIGVTLRQQLNAFERAIAIDSGFLLSHPHAVQLGIRAGGAALGRRYAALYLARDPRGLIATGIRAVNEFLAQPVDSVVFARWSDSLQGSAFGAFREALGRWPDPAESALRMVLQKRVEPGGKVRDSAHVPGVANWLASRGHVRRASELLGTRLPLTSALNRGNSQGPHVFVDLSLIGSVPAETAAAVFETWRRTEALTEDLGVSFLMAHALPWWASQADTMTLQRVTRRATAAVLRNELQDQTAPVPQAWHYLAAAAPAYLALAKHDTTEALRRFMALPDSLCVACDVDGLVRVRLLAATGRDREAYARLEAVFPDQSDAPRVTEALWILERARVAERLGDRKTAGDAYQWVVGIWRHADPELLSYVAEARAGLARVADVPATGRGAAQPGPHPRHFLR